MATHLLTHLLALLLSVSSSATVREETLDLQQPAEVIATLTAGCTGCSWAVPGREAAVLVMEIDGRYSQHIVLLRGEKPADYSVFLGPLAAGSHRVRIKRDERSSSKGVGAAVVESITFRSVAPSDADHAAIAHAPYIYARPGTLAAKSDMPLLTWYETEETPRGRKMRYSVVFTNEDGGTPVDRLMATWGRTTDVEFVYEVELDANGRVVGETYQAKGHELLPFTGRREVAHPLLWVVTENNMVGDRGKTRERFAPAPRPADLTDRTREAVMDDAPWTYRVSSEEVRRERRVSEAAAPGSKMIPDPRRFVFLEACAPGENVVLAVAVGFATDNGRLAWHVSDTGGPRFRISREPHNFPNGCFQSALAVPPGTDAKAIRALRVQAYTRPPGKDETPLPVGTGRARLLRVNRLFMLDISDEPGPSLLEWTGDIPLVGEGPPAEIPIERRPPEGSWSNRYSPYILGMEVKWPTGPSSSRPAVARQSACPGPIASRARPRS